MARGIVVFLAFIISLGQPAIADAQDATSIPVLIPDNFKEVRDPVQPISGSGLKGVFYPNPTKTITPSSLYVNLGSSAAFPLDVSIITFDGRYEASWSVTASAIAQGWARLQYDPAYRDWINDLDGERVATLVRDANGHALPISWGTARRGQQLSIMINSERADSYLVARSGQSYKRVDCRPVSSNRMLRYDKICTFDPNRLKLRDGKVEVRRKQGGSPLSPILFSLSN